MLLTIIGFSVVTLASLTLLKLGSLIVWVAVLALTLMGLDRIATVSVVLSLQRGMLFKSMTAHADHRVWQDVYHAPCPNGKTAYIKVTVQVGAIVIRFKEK